MIEQLQELLSTNQGFLILAKSNWDRVSLWDAIEELQNSDPYRYELYPVNYGQDLIFKDLDY